jgi:ferredoxin
MTMSENTSEAIPIEIDTGRCIRCGACALLAPDLFQMTAEGARPRQAPADAGQWRFARAAVLVCPSSAIRVRAAAGETAAAPDRAALYPQLARLSEQVRWSLADVAWSRLQPEQAPPWLRALVREMAFSEHATYSATQRFMHSFAEDVDFTQWLSVWFYEETRHPHALQEWLRRLNEPLDDHFVLRGRVSTPFMKSKMGTLVTNIVSEVTAASAYQALGASAGEPVLAQIATFIAGDEARHASSFFRFARRRLETAAAPDRERLDALKVLHFWLNESAQVSHPINQMLERLRADGGQALGAVDFDLGVVQRRVTHLVGLLIDRRLNGPGEVEAALRTLTAEVHAHQRTSDGPAPASEPPGE